MNFACRSLDVAHIIYIGTYRRSLATTTNARSLHRGRTTTPEPSALLQLKVSVCLSVCLCLKVKVYGFSTVFS